jgi:hypothetical protein
MALRGHTLVAIFPSFARAAGAIRSLEARGFDPAHVEAVADDAGAASEVAARTYARMGFFGGLAFGALLALTAVVIGDLGRYPVAVAVGAFWVVGGFAMIGLVLGREIVRRAPDGPLFAQAVRDGGTVVAVDCGERCDVAHEIFDQAGAADVRDETQEGP